MQVIRIGDHKNKYHRLTNFTEKDNKLKYEFENDIILVLKKKDDAFQMNLVDLYNNRYIMKNIDPINVKYFKTISLSNVSKEIDKIHNFFNDEK